MNSIKNFFNRVTQCAIDPASYRTLRSQKLSSAYGYLYWLLFLTSLVTTLWIAAALVHALPHIRSVAKEIETTLPTLYPKQLIVTVQSGALTTNIKEPFAIEIPQKWHDAVNADGEKDIPKNLAIFDTKATPEDYGEYDTLVLFSKNYMVTGDEDGQLRVITYDRLEKPLVVNYSKYQDVLKKVFEGFKTFLPVAKILTVLGLITAPFLFAGLGLLWWMFILLISSLILWFVSSLAKWGYKYNEIYKLSVYGATPVIILGMLLSIVGLGIPWVLQIFFFVWMWVLLKKLH